MGGGVGGRLERDQSDCWIFFDYNPNCLSITWGVAIADVNVAVVVVVDVVVVVVDVA